jgi:photosystem II stability/assembly factor-like uncharacterized protein
MLARRPILFLPILLLAAAIPARAEAERWVPTGPDMGFVTVLAAAPSQPATVYAGVGEARVYRSADRGLTWTRGGRPPGVLRILSLGVDAKAPRTVYALGNWSLFRSTDGGRSWRAVLRQTDGMPVHGMLVHPQVSGLVYAVHFDGRLLRSENGGETWTAFRPPRKLAGLTADPTRRNVLYATGDAPGIFKSTDAGATWQLLRRGLDPQGDVDVLAIDPSSPETLFVIQGGRLFRSWNGGASWSAVGTVPGGQLARNLAVEPGRRPALFLIADQSPYRSTDGGKTWQRAAAPAPAQELLATPAGVLAGTSAGVFRTVNRGASWIRSSHGFQEATIGGLAIHPTQPVLYAATLNGFLLKSPDGGRSWSLMASAPPDELGTFLPGPVVLAPSRPATVYAGIPGGTLRSHNSGRRWVHSADLGCVVPSSLAVDPADHATLYLAAGALEIPCDPCRLFKSVDSGASWACIGEGLPGTGASLVAADPHHSGVLYAVSQADLYRSEDGGLSWSLLYEDLQPTVLALSPAVPGLLFAGLPDGVARSTDGGQTWTFATEGLPDGTLVGALALDPVDPAVLYAATPWNGVFKSTDGGATWKPVGTGLEGLQVTALVLDPLDRKTLYVGTTPDGVWRLTQE